MRYSVNVPNFGDFQDPRVVADLARTAEQAGWDGLWVWDHVLHVRAEERALADPWVLLTAAALATDRIRLGAMVTPVARRRPITLAKTLTTLDRLSGGRMVCGVGLGAPIGDEFGRFGEPTDPRVLAERLDEGLDALAMLWSGEPAHYQGRHVVLDDVLCLPVPVQRPRIPVWVAGNWPNRRPLRRAARWDGVIPILPGTETGELPSAGDVARVVEVVGGQRAETGALDRPFDVVIGGTTAPEQADRVAELAGAGATWWDERRPFDDRVGELGPLLRRVEQGPPRLAP
ncbi:LLM class flavin-dependent oxidoreductase [Pseudonocardia sp. HH130630-07]|uniref:LLM class flavin-dependent oxidoreductase n=1 Tax=Pseudonocardia sp. HH130630-07 TaxID=1690815 RepID=UPI000814D5FE|nr:LLM class flavin-dependent oxidoreductase [Pseudonocardia sp. HH130630-07]ANY09330.1 luciferase [Pseudonocardia sp. HH130630-07]